ncbi:unnamed protein product [Prorocentrum cordatum]|uniref:Uncharacterized protein n=1 Tax=Prorocentrum cordatum TaxID=2364126 RepID=A0ABN9PF42_9DINO|nr:unnamed protein product [Polarella glacialis]
MPSTLQRSESLMISDEALGSIGEALDSRQFRAALQDRLAVLEAISSNSEKIGVHVSGLTLAICAGMVNAVAFAKFGTYVSHVSGSSTAIGLRQFGDQPGDVPTPALLVLDFIVGSTLCGLLIPKATLKIGKAPYSSALMILALIMASPIVMSGHGLLGAHLLALGCGLQNGLCSSWSGNVIRTTHMTGTGTDLGLAVGRIISRFLSKCRSFAPEDWEEHTADRNKVILMSLLLAGFIGGACLGSIAYNALKLWTLLMPSGLYCSLALVHDLYVHSQGETIQQSVALETQFERQLSGASEFQRQKSGESKQANLLGSIQDRLAVLEAISSNSEKIGVHVSGLTLAICAGMVNAVAFAKFGTYVSHVSGSSTAIGLRQFGDQPGDVPTPALLVLDFIVGSTLCGLLIPKATLKIGKAPYSSALMILALIMASPIVLSGHGLLGAHLLALGCGLQNGLCSSWSGNVIRTTHMTGTGTDLGLAVGRIISRFLSKCRSFAPEDWEEHTADRNKVILMSLLLAGFIGGACLGSIAYNALKLWTLLMPSGLYCSLALVHDLYVHSQGETIQQSVALETQFERQLSGASEFQRQKSGESKQANLLGPGCGGFPGRSANATSADPEPGGARRSVELCERWLGGAQLPPSPAERIPCLVHQQWKTTEDEGSLPQMIQAHQFRRRNPGCVHRFWSDEEIDRFVAEEFPDLLPASIWRQLEPIQRADLFRYAVVYRLGGFYADVDVECLKPLESWGLLPDTRLVAGYETGWHMDDDGQKAAGFSRFEQFEQWVFGAAPGHSALRRCLELFRERLEWDIETTVELTGPAVFSDAVKEFLRAEARRLGLPTSLARPRRGAAVVVQDGRAVRAPAEQAALRFPPPGLPQAGVLLLSAEEVSVPGFSAPGSITTRSLVRHGFMGVWKKDPPAPAAQLEWPPGPWPGCAVGDLALQADGGALVADVAALFGAAAGLLSDCSDPDCRETGSFSLRCGDGWNGSCEEFLESACALACRALEGEGGCRFWTAGASADSSGPSACWLLTTGDHLQLRQGFRSAPSSCAPPRAAALGIPWAESPARGAQVPRLVHRGCRHDPRLVLGGREVALFSDPISRQGYASFRDRLPGARHLLWTDADFSECARREFPAHAPAFDALPAELRAEAGRYCALHRFGGVYADLDYEARRDFHAEHLAGGGDATAYVAASPYGPPDDAVQASLLAGPRQHPLWRLAFAAAAAAPSSGGAAPLAALLRNWSAGPAGLAKVSVLRAACSTGPCGTRRWPGSDASDPSLAAVHWSAPGRRGSDAPASLRQAEVLSAFRELHGELAEAGGELAEGPGSP